MVNSRSSVGQLICDSLRIATAEDRVLSSGLLNTVYYIINITMTSYYYIELYIIRPVVVYIYK